MVSSELPFGPSPDGPSVYLDTSHSDTVDATASELLLYIPGDNFVLEASYERLGPDLLLSGEEYSVLVKGYFTHERHRICIRQTVVRSFPALRRHAWRARQPLDNLHKQEEFPRKRGSALRTAMIGHRNRKVG